MSQALLLVAEWPGPGRRWLSVRVESPSLPPWGGSGRVHYIGPASAPAVPATPPP